MGVEVEPWLYLVDIAVRSRHWQSKGWLRAVETDDLWQDGALGLLEACSTWNKTIPFAPYALRIIQGRITDGLRRMDIARSYRAELQAQAATLRQVWLDEDIPDPRSGPDLAVQLREQREWVVRRLAGLPVAEQRVVKHYYGLDGRDPVPYHRIGEMFDCSAQRVEQLRSKACARMRKNGAVG